jgi:8-oxo-dGTP diphosphatase
MGAPEPRPALTVDVVLLAGTPPASVLLIERANEPQRGWWALPGGFVDGGERVAAAARRELREETGIAIDGDGELLGVYDAPGRDPRRPTISIAYLHRAPAKLAASGADDARSARWFEVSRLPELAFDHALIVADALRRAAPQPDSTSPR